MEIVITGFGNKGDLANERVGLKVLRDCDTKFYLLFKTSFSPNNIFLNRTNASYWFAPRNVKTGDQIVVYTRAGNDSQQVNPDGTTTYFLYWGLSQPIYGTGDSGVVLTEIKSWDSSKGK
jgi:hypothetical protein